MLWNLLFTGGPGGENLKRVGKRGRGRGRGNVEISSTGSEVGRSNASRGRELSGAGAQRGRGRGSEQRGGHYGAVPGSGRGRGFAQRGGHSGAAAGSGRGRVCAQIGENPSTENTQQRGRQETTAPRPRARRNKTPPPLKHLLPNDSPEHLVLQPISALPNNDACESYVGPTNPLLDDSPTNYFSQFIDTEVLDLIIEETIRYARKEKKMVGAKFLSLYIFYFLLQPDFDLTREELLSFLGITIAFGKFLQLT